MNKELQTIFSKEKIEEKNKQFTDKLRKILKIFILRR